ncbi:MAG: hypothetical protein KC464_33410, partial [Myxococcales bacterium]|nr:hypothetical protein [Myxococcales bacterium]
DELRRRGLPLADALDRLVHRHPPRLLAALRDYHGGEDAEVVRSLKIRELSCAMVLEDDVLAHNGMVVVPRGQAVTPVMLERLARFAGGQGLVEPVRVRITAGAT